METHVCRWKSITEWRDESADLRWKVVVQHRLQRCSSCSAERNLRALGRRRRQRNAVNDQSGEPAELRVAAAEQRWRSIAEALAKLNTTRAELEPRIIEWLGNGWVEVEEVQDIHNKAWDIEKLRLSLDAVELLIRRPLQERQQTIDASKLDALTRLSGWQSDLKQAYAVHSIDDEITRLLERLSSILTEQETALQNGAWTLLPGTTLRLGDLPHQRWLYALRGIVAVLASNHWEYERAFAARWLGHSKALITDRKDLETYLCLPLEKLGLFKHSPIMYCWGPFTADFEGRVIDGQAGLPFIALSADTVQVMNLVALPASAILVIENQTAFEFMLRSPLRKPDWLYIFSGGHAGYTEREFMLKCLGFAPQLTWHVWTDWDFGGVRIQIDWTKWAESNGVSAPYAWWWNRSRLDHWSTCGTPLDGQERIKLQNLDHPLAELLIGAGITIEQEAVLHEIKENDFSLRR